MGARLILGANDHALLLNAATQRVQFLRGLRARSLGGRTMKLEGGCYCKALRYIAEGEPMLKAQCHCRECQYICGGAPQPVHR